VIDDNAANLKLVRIVLVEAGFTVRSAIDAESALELLAAMTPDAIVTDLKLPGMGGIELVKRLGRDPRRAKMAIIVLTAHAMPGEADAARAAGCDDFLTKPVDIDLLVESVTRAIRSRPG
jgi:two-component system cell cycle response regulator DivK